MKGTLVPGVGTIVVAPKDPYDQDKVIQITEAEHVISPEDSEEVKCQYLIGACYKRMVLSGIVSAVLRPDSVSPQVVVDYEGMPVRIPAREMFVEQWPEDERAPKEVMFKLKNMQGATVEFMVAGAELDSRTVYGNRRAAMLLRQKQFFESRRVKENSRVACRVIGVGGGWLIVESFGVETRISSSEASWEWFSDISNLYAVGDVLVARVLDITRDEETGSYQARLSIKQASANPDIKVLSTMQPGSMYYGVVTGVRDRLYFCRLQIGANAKTRAFMTKDVPKKDDTVCFLVKDVSLERGVAYGLITRIIKHHVRPR